MSEHTDVAGLRKSGITISDELKRLNADLAAATKERDEAREALKGLLGEAWRSCMKAVATDKCPTSCSNAACRHAQAILARLSAPAPCATCGGSRVLPRTDGMTEEPCPTCGGEGKR